METKENKLQDVVQKECKNFSCNQFNSVDRKDKVRILDIQEKERQRIARDLHDCSLQDLTHLIHKLELCSMEMDDDIVQAKLEIASIRLSLKQIIEDIRNTIFDLRPMPFDDLGVKEVFSRLEENLRTLCDMKIHFKIGEISSDSSVLLMTIFRIIYEGAINSVKHSEGENLYVSLTESSDTISIVIEDDGKGFDVESNKDGHFGLCILRERVTLLSGSMDITSNDKGTKIHVFIPLY